MGKLGFYCFTQPTQPEVPTLKQQVKALSDSQRNILLEGFISIKPDAHFHKDHIPQQIVKDVYDTISAIQERCRSLMRGEVIITPEVSHIDPVTLQKVVDTPAVYNIPPATKVALKTIVKDEFNDTFPNTFTGDVIEMAIKCTKWDRTGDFAFYRDNIVL